MPHASPQVAAVTLRVASMDGTSFPATVPHCGCVFDVKSAIGRVSAHSRYPSVSPHAFVSDQLGGIEPTSIELFVEGAENPLQDAGPLESVGVVDGMVLFMLPRPGAVLQAQAPSLLN